MDIVYARSELQDLYKTVDLLLFPDFNQSVDVVTKEFARLIKHAVSNALLFEEGPYTTKDLNINPYKGGYLKDLMVKQLNIPITEVPKYINELPEQVIARWRLKIGK